MESTTHRTDHQGNLTDDGNYKTSSSKSTLLSVMDVQVVESEKRTFITSMGMKDNFVAYLIECKVTDSEFKGADRQSSLWRRYSEFELLHDYLICTFSYVVVPPLPEKRVSWASYPWQKPTTDKFDPDFIDRRRSGLERFILRIATHQILCFNKIFMGFLQQEDDWKESVFSTGFQSLNEGMLKSLNASFRLKNCDRRFEETKSYCNELQSNVSSMIKIRTRVAERLFAIHKVHSNYGREFSEWSSFEKSMGDCLQSIGHYMDAFAALVDSLVEEEETMIDQLKEYYYFADTLKNVCRKYELLQYEVEKAEENLSSKANQKEQVMNGNSGLISRWFKSPDTEETKEMKINNLNQLIQEAEVHLRLANEEAQAFEEKALIDIQRFKKQKVTDLKEALKSYISLQMKICKKGINVWTNTKDCLDQFC